MLTIALIMNILAAFYLLYLTTQHAGEREFWRGYIYTWVIYTYMFCYILNRNIPGIVIMSVLYILAICDLKRSEEDGA